jgi:hypothetical protein
LSRFSRRAKFLGPLKHFGYGRLRGAPVGAGERLRAGAGEVRLGAEFAELVGGPNQLRSTTVRLPHLDGVPLVQQPPALAKQELDHAYLAAYLDAEVPGRLVADIGAAPAPAARKVGARSAAAAALSLRNDDSASEHRKEPSSFLSGAEIARLRQLQTDVLEGRVAPDGAPTSHSRKRLLTSEYARENERIRRTLLGRRAGSASSASGLQRVRKSPEEVMKSTALDNLMYLERLEHAAAGVLQRAWHRYRRLCYWDRWVAESQRGAVSPLAAVTSQSSNLPSIASPAVGSLPPAAG